MTSPRLHPALESAEPEQRARALAKAARVLSKLRPDDALRGHTENERSEGDVSLRRVVVRQAFNDDRRALTELAVVVGDGEDGIRFLLRALNNLRRVDSRAASTLSLVLLEAIEARADRPTMARSLAKQLHAIHKHTSLTGRIVDQAVNLLKTSYIDPTDSRSALLQELVAYDLRVDPDSDQLVKERGALRPLRLTGDTRDRLEAESKRKDLPWSQRLAALWFVGALDSAGHRLTTEALDDAYQTYPLESLAAVEQVLCAVDYEASTRVDEMRLASELSRLRSRARAEHLTLAGITAALTALADSLPADRAGQVGVDDLIAPGEWSEADPTRAAVIASLIDHSWCTEVISALGDDGLRAILPLAFAETLVREPLTWTFLETLLEAASGKIDGADNALATWIPARRSADQDLLHAVAKQLR